jgi:molecular chaperone DnaK
VRNQAEQLSYSIDKLIKDNDDKLPEAVKTEVQADVDALKAALAGEDDDAVKTAFDKLNQSQGKLGEAIYASSQASQPDASTGAPTDSEAGAGSGSEDSSAQSSDEDVIDAEVVDDEDEKK